MTSTDMEWLGTLFTGLADLDYKGTSPLYETLARQSAHDHEVLSLLDPAAPRDRYPHLLFAAVQYLLLADGADPLAVFAPDPFPRFRRWCRAHRDEIEGIVATHVTQTNEVGRCAALMPCLAAVAEAAGRPLAVIEVGASAGLNLLFDRYRYVYGADTDVGAADAPVVLRPRVDGAVPAVRRLPEVAWRRGLDRLPVDVTDDEAVRWLRACIWPEQAWRRELLERAVALARSDPPTLIAGDAIDALPALVDQAPDDAALCIVHTAVLPYLPDRARFADTLAELARRRPLWRVPGEPQGFIDELPEPPAADGTLTFLYGVVPLGVGGGVPRTLARAGSHGAWIEWLGPFAGADGGR